jgi:hypothetical protein
MLRSLPTACSLRLSCQVIADYILDPNMGPFQRTKRKSKKVQ